MFQNQITKFFVIFVIFLKICYCYECPNLSTYDNPQKNQGYAVKNYLRIPKTNVLVVNTYYQQNEDSSIVYYNDMSSSSGEIINIIKPNYVILDMQYNTQTDQIVISNYDNLIFADPYTLKPISSFSIPNLSSIQIVKDTNYIILTNSYNTLQIFDFVLQKVVLLMDNTSELETFPNQFWIYQYYSDIYTLKNEKTIIVTTNKRGVIAWGIDLEKLTYKFYGYIQDSVVITQGDKKRCFTKHPTEDIIFMAGQNLQLLAVQIVDIENKVYNTLLNEYLNIEHTSGKLDNIQFVYQEYQGYYYPCVWVGEEEYIYYVYLYIEADFTAMYLDGYYSQQISTYYRWYTIEENSQFFISSLNYITIFNYQTFEYIYNLYFYGDLYSRKFIRQKDGEHDRFVLLSGNQVLLYDKGVFGTYYTDTQKPALQGQVKNSYSSFYQIKNTFDWYFMKSENQQSSLIFTFRLYPLSEQEQVIDITQSYGLSWNQINQNLDPFFLNDKIWVAVAFPSKKDTENYLFQLINSQSSTERYYLTSNQSDVTSIKTSYAIPSLEDKDNLELIGIDINGNIYSWDLSKDNTPFKYSKSFSLCKNSQIGQVFQYQQIKKLILSCDDNNVYSFDLQTGGYQFISKFTTQPLALRAFSSSSLIAIGDFNSGIALIYKFNSQSFDFFLQIQSNQILDKLIYIEMLNDQTIWIQYIQRNLFYSIGDCLNDSNLCTQCTQKYYFDATSQYDKSGVYGMGTVDKPFTTSENFLTAMIKAQQYKQLIHGVSNMNVEILISPDNKLELNPNLMDFDFNRIISLNFQSQQSGTYSSLEYKGTLSLQNYNQIDFQDIIIYFQLSQDNSDCGLVLANIQQGISLNNIQLLSDKKTSIPKSCQSIYIDSCKLRIKKYNINKEDFTNHQSIISTFNSTSIILENISLTESTLGDSFSILSQQSNIQATISNLTLSSNICPQTSNQNDEVISVLFSAGLFTVTNMTMAQNTLCKKSIFSTVSALSQNNQIFSFENINLQNNLFQARTTYVFFDAFYSMRSSPSHKLNLKNVTFLNNQLVKYGDNDMIVSSFFQTSKIADITIIDTKLNNHFDIQLGIFENAINVNINKFYCENDEIFFSNIPNRQTVGCLQLQEVYDTKMTDIQVTKKKSQDSTLISLQNNQIQQSNLQIIKGSFSDIILNQNGVNTVAIPLYVVSNYQIDMQLDTCLFSNIFLQSIQYTLTYSTTALWVVNYVGSVIIKNSQFLNSYSNSQYGFIYIQTNQLIIDNVSFKNSTFTNNQSLQLFNSQGGMINAKASNITIIDSDFSEATASKGSFLYLTSFGQTFYLNFTNILFSEGYAMLDGGAMFIDTNGLLLQLNCNNCQFNNIFTIFTSASTIGQQKYAQLKTKDKSSATFKGGYIKNTYGVIDNYFIDVKNMDLQFLQIQSISSENFITNSIANYYYQNQESGHQFATLANLLNSTLLIDNCNIENIQISSVKSVFPLLISSQNSKITLSDSVFQNSNFTTSAIYTSQSNLIMTKVKFENVNQIKASSRLLQQDAYQNPSDEGNSLIIADQTQININTNSIFSSIDCTQNCNGGALQVNQGILNIDSTTFSLVKSSFGGALFIQGMNQTNQISNTKFLNCNSQNDGGAIYFNSLLTDKFSLNIHSSVFQQNSCNNRGGAIFVNSQTLNAINKKILMENSKVIGNEASIGGGIFNQNLSVNTNTDNEFSGNIGNIYGGDKISYPSQMSITNMESFLKINDGIIDGQQIRINNFRSGGNLTDIQIIFLNNNKEIVFPITSDELETFSVKINFDPNIKQQSSYSISGDTQVKYNKSLKAFKFDNITLIGTPGSQANILFTSEQIYTLNEKTQQFEQNYSFLVTINFRLCGPGEQSATIGQETQCQICPINYYSFEASDCKECPQGAICNGGTQLVTNPGYWRRSNSSDEVLRCSNLPDNCVGGDYGDQTCYEGHIGALCEECDIYGQSWSTSYAKSAKFQCTRCDEIKGNIWIVVLMTIWTLISMCLAIKGDVDVLREKVAVLTIQKHLKRKSVSVTREKRQTSINYKSGVSFNSYQDNKQFRQPSIQFYQQKNKTMQFKSDEDKSGILIKMLTNYVQIVGSIATFNLSIPSGIFEFPQSVGEPLKQTMNSLDCALQGLDSSVPIIYLRLIFSLIIPLIYMLIFLLCMLLYYVIKKISKDKKQDDQQSQIPWYILTTAIMFLIIYIQPDLVAQIIALLSCRQVGDTKYILSNVSFQCYTSQHYFYALILIIPMLILWVIILPVILFMVLRRNKNNLEDIDIKLKYGFLYKEYQNYAFYWEFVKMAEKLAIILALNFYSQSIVTKAVLVFIVISSYGILSMILQPYQEPDINEIDVNSTNVCALTVLLGLFMYDNKFPYFVYTSLSFIVILNLWFIIKILRRIVGGYLPKIHEVIQSVVVTLSKKYSYFQRFVKEETQKKQIKPEVKQRYKQLFQKILSMKPQEKKAFYLKVMEQQLIQSYAHLFSREDNDLENQQTKQDLNEKMFSIDQGQKFQSETSIKQFKKLETSMISSPPPFDEVEVNQPKSKDFKMKGLIQLNNQFSQSEVKEDFSTRNQNLDSNAMLFNFSQKQVNTENNNQVMSSRQKSEIIDEEQVEIELESNNNNQNSESQKS